MQAQMKVRRGKSITHEREGASRGKWKYSVGASGIDAAVAGV